MRRVLTATTVQKYPRMMSMTHNCRVCGDTLNNENWYLANRKNYNYICKECGREQQRLYLKNNPEIAKAQSTRGNRKRGHLPMSENKYCTQYLGIFWAERVLRNIYPDVVRMQMNHPGYDLICNKGMKVDVKSGCILKDRNGWQFRINYNAIADYFICLAFDNRQDLNPLHLWLIPGQVLNHLTCTSISPSTIHKWDDYRLSIDKVVACCDIIKGD